MSTLLKILGKDKILKDYVVYAPSFNTINRKIEGICTY